MMHKPAHPRWVLADRLHILLAPEEKERYREIADAQGLNLSDWVRRTVREAAERYGAGPGLRDAAGLRRFFEASDDVHGPDAGAEPDWEEHLRVLERGKTEGGREPR